MGLSQLDNTPRRVEGIDPGFGFDLATLGATTAERLPDRQGRLDGRRGLVRGGGAWKGSTWW